MPPVVMVRVPKPRAILPALTSGPPGSSYANVTNMASSVGRGSDPTDYIGQLGSRITSDIAAQRKAANVDVTGLINRIKSQQSNWKPNVAGMIGPLKISGGGGSLAFPTGKVSGGVDQWIAKAYKILGIPLTSQALANERYLIQHESSGNPRAINNWDINAKRGTPSKGLTQTIDPTFSRYKLPGYNDIWNPVDNLLASLRYRKSRYGKYDIGRYSGGY